MEPRPSRQRKAAEKIFSEAIKAVSPYNAVKDNLKLLSPKTRNPAIKTDNFSLPLNRFKNIYAAASQGRPFYYIEQAS